MASIVYFIFTLQLCHRFEFRTGFTMLANDICYLGNSTGAFLHEKWIVTGVFIAGVALQAENCIHDVNNKLYALDYTYYTELCICYTFENSRIY